ncbi:MAG: hypothetical protein ACREOK_10535 [Gemmatimonadaceae bacterium]
MRTFLILASFVVPVSVAAQASKTKTPSANIQQQSTQTKSPQTKAPPTKAALPTKAGAPRTKAAAARDARTAGGTKTAQGQPAITVGPETAQRSALPTIMREIYDYDTGGRRDPFVSLLTSEDLRPMISDLRLVSILYDESGRRPIAVMRDVQTNAQYRVTTGSTLGRLKVALIKRKAVIFSIEEFGLNRQDSLVLGDTTKARTR